MNKIFFLLKINILAAEQYNLILEVFVFYQKQKKKFSDWKIRFYFSIAKVVNPV
jgi:hypothetical protein